MAGAETGAGNGNGGDADDGSLREPGAGAGKRSKQKAKNAKHRIKAPKATDAFFFFAAALGSGKEDILTLMTRDLAKKRRQFVTLFHVYFPTVV